MQLGCRFESQGGSTDTQKSCKEQHSGPQGGMGVRPWREGRRGNTEVRSRWAEAADGGSQRNQNPQRGQASGLLVEHPRSPPSRGGQLRLCAVPAFPSFPDFPSPSPTHTQRRKECEQRDTRRKKEVRTHGAKRIFIKDSDESGR